MSLLGLVIISFGFRVYTQRDTMKRHFPEIVGATFLSSIFSLFSTAFAAKAIGLSAGGWGICGGKLQLPVVLSGLQHTCLRDLCTASLGQAKPTGYQVCCRRTG